MTSYNKKSKFIGIVGSRDWNDREKVAEFINKLDEDVTIVSGGAKGVDSLAVEIAQQKNFKIVEYLPDLTNCTKRFEYTKEYYNRNQKIVDKSDELVAFVVKETGGTWDTIKRAKKKGIPVRIIREDEEE